MKRVAGSIAGALVLVATAGSATGVGGSANPVADRDAAWVGSAPRPAEPVLTPQVQRSERRPVPMPAVRPARPGPVPMPIVEPAQPGPVPMPLLRPGLDPGGRAAPPALPEPRLSPLPRVR